MVNKAEKKWSTKLDIILDKEQRTLERCEDEIVIRRERVAYLEQVKADDMGDRNLWRYGLPKLPTWKQKAKKHAGKRFGSKLAQGAEKKRKIDECQALNSSELRVRFFSDSEVSDPARRVVCVSADEDRDDVGSGPTPSVPELVFILAVRSPAQPHAEEGEDSAVFKELQEMLDESTPSGSKETVDAPSKPNPKVGMNLKRWKRSGLRSRIGDQRIYSYDEGIECQEKLYDSDDFDDDDVEKIF